MEQLNQFPDPEEKEIADWETDGGAIVFGDSEPCEETLADA